MSTVQNTPATTIQSPSSPVIRRPVAVGVSVLSFAISIGLGHLVAGVINPASSPYQAVADAVVRLAPGWAIEFGKTLVLPGLPVGRADKFALLVGVGVVLFAIAGVAGLMSRSSPRPGLRILFGVGLIGLIAVVTSPVFRISDISASMAALVGGLGTFPWLHSKALIQARGTHTTLVGGPTAPDPHERALPRRNLLLSSAAVAVAATTAGLAGVLLGNRAGRSSAPTEPITPMHPSSPAAPLPPAADFADQGTPTFLTSNRDFYRIDTALRVPAQAAADWSLRVHGLVDRELTITYADLLARPLIERPVTLTCVSNDVGGHLISTANFAGVSLRDLLNEAGVQPGAQQLFSTSLDGFTCGTPTEVVMEPRRDAMLVIGMNAEPLPPEHGYPVRMVVPGLYGFVSATKWLVDLELTTFDAKQAYWLQRGWAREGPIKTQSRIDRPRTGQRVPSGIVTVAGIAWAQHRGIAGVEVRLDNGPWQPTRLSTEVSSDTWRMWVTALNVPPGNHRLTCRATDAGGTTQTPVPAQAIPDGATGWSSIDFTAT